MLTADRWQMLLAYLTYDLKPSAAAADVEQALDDRPMAALWRARGLARGALGQWSDAQADFSQAVLRDPDDGHAWRGRALAHAELSLWPQAVADCTVALEHSQAWDLWYLRAVAHSQLHQSDRAAADYERALALGGEGWPLRLERAEVYRALGLWDKAADDLARALTLLPADSPQRLRLVSALLPWEPALARLVELRPDDLPLCLDCARLFTQQKQWDQAAVYFGKAVAYKPDDPQHWLGRGQCYIALEQWDNAADDFAKATELRPQDAGLWSQQALLRLAAGDAAGYRQVCAGLVNRFRDDPNPQTTQIVVSTCRLAPESVMDLSGLVQLAERGVAADPNSCAFRHPLGGLLHRAGQYDQSITQLDAAVKACAGQGAPLDWLFLAMAHHRLGHAEVAKQWLEKGQKWIDAFSQAPPAEAAAGTGPSWNQRLEWQLVRRETEALLNAQAPESKE